MLFPRKPLSPILTVWLAANWCQEILVPVLAGVVESALTFLYSCPPATAWRFFLLLHLSSLFLKEWDGDYLLCTSLYTVHCTLYTVHWCVSLFCTASAGEESSKLWWRCRDSGVLLWCYVNSRNYCQRLTGTLYVATDSHGINIWKVLQSQFYWGSYILAELFWKV